MDWMIRLLDSVAPIIIGGLVIAVLIVLVISSVDRFPEKPKSKKKGDRPPR